MLSYLICSYDISVETLVFKLIMLIYYTDI